MLVKAQYNFVLDNIHFMKYAKKLTAKERKKLPKSAFAIPEKRKYPIHDENHARAALTYVARYGTPEEKKRVRAAVCRRYGIGCKNEQKAANYNLLDLFYKSALMTPSRIEEIETGGENKSSNKKNTSKEESSKTAITPQLSALDPLVYAVSGLAGGVGGSALGTAFGMPIIGGLGGMGLGALVPYALDKYGMNNLGDIARILAFTSAIPGAAYLYGNYLFNQGYNHY